MLAAIQDVRLVVWYTPGAASFSQQLLRMSSLQYDNGELGRSPRVTDFNGTWVFVRRVDGSLLNIPIRSYAIMLHDYVLENKWPRALNLCRMVQVTIHLFKISICSKSSNFRILHYGLVLPFWPHKQKEMLLIRQKKLILLSVNQIKLFLFNI